MRLVVCSMAVLCLAGCGADRARSAGTRADTVADAGAADGSSIDAGPSEDAGGAAGADAATTVRDGGAPAPDAGFIDAGPGAPDSGTPGSGPCPRASGFTGVGRAWQSRSTAAYEAESGYQFTSASEIVAFTDLGTHVEVEVHGTNHVFGTTNGATFVSDTDSTVVYRCDGAGMAIVSQVSTSQSTYDGTRTDSTSTLTYTPAMLMLPSSLQVGESWTVQSSQHSAGVSGGQPYEQTSDVTYEATVSGRTSVTMPAGSFSGVWQVTRDWGNYVDVGLYADEVGYLGNQSNELVSYQ